MATRSVQQPSIPTCAGIVLNNLPLELNLTVMSFLRTEDILKNKPVCTAWSQQSELIINYDSRKEYIGCMCPNSHKRYKFLLRAKTLFEEFGGKLVSCQEEEVPVDAWTIRRWYLNQEDILKRLIETEEELPKLLGLPNCYKEEKKRTAKWNEIWQATKHSFKQFMQIILVLEKTVQYRQKYLEKFFILVNRCEAPKLSTTWANVRLTKLGLKACALFFNYFDRDNDGVLSYSELRSLNQAAGLDLDARGYNWVQIHFDTNIDGRLTPEGYRAMFTDNCGRVPALMFKDLVRLLKYIKENTGEPGDGNAKRVKLDESHFCLEPVETGLIGLGSIDSATPDTPPLNEDLALQGDNCTKVQYSELTGPPTYLNTVGSSSNSAHVA